MRFNREDLTGKKYNMLTVIAYDGNDKWTVKCDCGNIKHMRASGFKYGQNKGCGCQIGKCRPTHGMSDTRLYSEWEAMKARCLNSHNKYYFNYGGRGIKVCDEWIDFVPFKEWAENNGYKDDLTLDRIDSNGMYCPDNCRWASRKEQANNTRRNVYLEYGGKRMTISEWADCIGISYDTLRWRLHHWPLEKALTADINEAYSRKRDVKA